jgi:hypothetical protein
VERPFQAAMTAFLPALLELPRQPVTDLQNFLISYRALILSGFSASLCPEFSSLSGKMGTKVPREWKKSIIFYNRYGTQYLFEDNYGTK